MKKLIMYIPWLIMLANLIISFSVKFNDLSHVQAKQDKMEAKLYQISERVSAIEGYMEFVYGRLGGHHAGSRLQTGTKETRR